ncbi:MAG: MopE-related protein [Flavobacteriales bacterium]
MKRVLPIVRFLLWSLLLLGFGLIYNEAVAYPGCTNPLAVNYDPLATIDDGTCCFNTAYITCDLLPNLPIADNGVKADWLTFILTQIGQSANIGSQGRLCTADTCTILRILDTLDNVVNNLNVWLRKNNITLINEQLLGQPTPVCYIIKGTIAIKYNWQVQQLQNCEEVEFGCTDFMACNFNPFATFDDGSCTYPNIYFLDADGDGYGNPAIFVAACAPPPNYVLNNLDCNDGDFFINPGATEVCNGLDDNCDFNIDDVAPAPPAAIAGPLAICSNVEYTYHSLLSQCATSYIWSAAPGCTILSGQGTPDITLSVDGSFWLNPTKYLCVTASNIYGNSAPYCIYLNDACNIPPQPPGPVSGAQGICLNAPGNYHIAPVPGADSYLWTASSGVSILNGQGTTDVSIEVTDWTPYTRKYLYVQAVNAYGTGPVTAFALRNCLAAPNDHFENATLITASGNAYPTCTNYASNLAHTATSPESGDVGNDVWFRFVALSNGVSITNAPNAFDVITELYNDAGVLLNTENVMGSGGTEILNYDLLMPGAQYRVCVRNTAPTNADQPFSICLKMIVASFCNDGSGSYDLCTNLKAKWTGAGSYTFYFTPVVPTPGIPTSASASASIALSSAALALQHGGIYDVYIDGTFNLLNGAGTPEVIVVSGIIINTISILPHADVQVKLQQRCSYPATLLKGTVLQGKPHVCGALQYMVEFQEVNNCAGATDIGLPFNALTAGASPSISLAGIAGVLAGHYYRVRWQPQFGYGAGIWGTGQVIFIGMPVMLLNGEENLAWRSQQDAEESEGWTGVTDDLENEEEALRVALYPNPNDGHRLLLNMTGVPCGLAQLEILDNTGKMIESKIWYAESSVKAIHPFGQRLSAGVYLVRMVFSDGQVVTERLFVN